MIPGVAAASLTDLLHFHFSCRFVCFCVFETVFWIRSTGANVRVFLKSLLKQVLSNTVFLYIPFFLFVIFNISRKI